MVTFQKEMNRLVTVNEVEDILNRLRNIGDNNVRLRIKSLSHYQLAFVHKSYTHEVDPTLPFIPTESNERLEFLGDGFIGAVIGKYLIDRFEEEQEGFLTKIRTRIVRSEMLHRFARFLAIGQFILLSPQVERLTYVGPNKGRNNPRLYEDCFEAFAGAIIQDFGDEEGYKYVKRWVISIVEHIIDFADIILCNENFKDTLQRYFQSQTVETNGETKKWPNPLYIDLAESGPSHMKVFTKGVFLKKAFLEMLSDDVIVQTKRYSKDMTERSSTTISKAINEYCEKNDCYLIGLGMGNKKGIAEQSASSIGLCNLHIDHNW